MKKEFIEPEVEIIYLDSVYDIVTASGDGCDEPDALVERPN